jgi:hypothetical protein
MHKRMLGLFLVLVLCLATGHTPRPVGADPGGTDPYTITWATVDGGGGLSTNGPYKLYVTVGQPDAWIMSCGDYPLSGGFWNPEVSESVCLRYLPLIER